MESCLFCSLINEKKLNLVYEDDRVVAFPDIKPSAPTHILVVPKKHITSVATTTEEDEVILGRLFTAARLVAKEQGITESGFRTIVNTGPDAGQEVMHIHMHVLGGKPLGTLIS